MKIRSYIVILLLLCACEVFQTPGKIPAKYRDLRFSVPASFDSLGIYPQLTYSKVLSIRRYLKSSDPESRIIAGEIIKMAAKNKIISINSAIDIILDGVEYDFKPPVNDSITIEIRKELILIISHLLMGVEKNVLKNKIGRLKSITEKFLDTRYHFLYILNFFPNQTLKNSFFEKIAIRELTIRPFSNLGYLSLYYLYSVRCKNEIFKEVLLKSFETFFYGPWKFYVPAETVLVKMAKDQVTGPPHYNMLYDKYPIPTSWWVSLYISAISSFGMEVIPRLKSIYKNPHLPDSARYWVGYTIALAMYEDKIDITEWRFYLQEIIENSEDSVLVEKAIKLLNISGDVDR